MTVTCEDHVFNPGAKAPVFILPGDDAQALKNGMVKSGYDKHMPKSIHVLDNAAYRLAQLVARKGWEFSGIDVALKQGGTIEEPFHRIASLEGNIEGMKWRVSFLRGGYEYGDQNVLTRPCMVTVPGHHISIHDDASGSYCRYVGQDWDAEEDGFLNGSHVNSKLRGETRTYLRYDMEAGYEDGHAFVHSDDVGREYGLEENDPFEIPADVIYNGMAAFLDGISDDLESLLDAPCDPYDDWAARVAIAPRAIPFEMPSLVVTERTRRYTYDDRKNQPKAILPGTGLRLCSLSSHTAGMNPLASEGFHYAYDRAPYHNALLRHNEPVYDPDTSIFKIDLKYANDIYVVDEYAYEAARSYLMEVAEDEGRTRFTEEELQEQRLAMINTLTPLEAYRQDYKKPVYLIHRPLYADEAKDITRDVRHQNEADSFKNEDAFREKTMAAIENFMQRDTRRDEKNRMTRSMDIE